MINQIVCYEKGLYISKSAVYTLCSMWCETRRSEAPEMLFQCYLYLSAFCIDQSVGGRWRPSGGYSDVSFQTDVCLLLVSIHQAVDLLLRQGKKQQKQERGKCRVRSCVTVNDHSVKRKVKSWILNICICRAFHFALVFSDLTNLFHTLFKIFILKLHQCIFFNLKWIT